MRMKFIHVHTRGGRVNSWRMRFEFVVYSAIQGYHEYKGIWENPIIGEKVKCQRVKLEINMTLLLWLC